MTSFCYVKDAHRLGWHITEYTIGCLQRPSLCGARPSGGAWSVLVTSMPIGAVPCPVCAGRQPQARMPVGAPA